MRVFQEGSRRSSRCKPGDRNFGGVAVASRKRASGVWKEEEKRVVGESPPIADAFAARDHTGTGKGGVGVGVARALLVTCVVIVRSVPRLPTTTTGTSARGSGGGGIRVLHADDANGTWCGFVSS